MNNFIRFFHWFLVLSLALGPALASAVPCQMTGTSSTPPFDEIIQHTLDAPITVHNKAGVTAQKPNCHNQLASSLDISSDQHQVIKPSCPRCISDSHDGAASLFDCFAHDGAISSASDATPSKVLQFDPYYGAFLAVSLHLSSQHSLSQADFHPLPDSSIPLVIYLLTQRLRI